jgi:hypothetical protein
MSITITDSMGQLRKVTFNLKMNYWPKLFKYMIKKILMVIT